MNLDPTHKFFIEAAERLEYETRQSTLEALEPWFRHSQACELMGPCSCGLEEVVEALRRDHRRAA